MRLLRTVSVILLQGVVGWVAAKSLDAFIVNPLAHDLLIGGVWLAVIILGGAWLIVREWRRGAARFPTEQPDLAGQEREIDRLSALVRPPETSAPAQSGWQELANELRRQRGVVRNHYAELESIVGPRPTPPSVQTASAQKGFPGKRAFVADNVTFEYLLGLGAGQMTHQIDALRKPFIGKWMRVSSTVRDVAFDSDGDGNVTVEEGGPFVQFRLYFGSSWSDHLSGLTRGSPIKAIGRIAAIESIWVWLRDCELVDA